MTTPEINLLAETPRGHTWLEVVLDLEPSDFRVEHVRDLGQALARFQDLGSGEIRVVSIARWRPIIVFEMPETNAERTVRSFERSSGDLLRALGGLSVCSMRLDAKDARTLSIRHPADRGLFERIRELLSSSFNRDRVLSVARLGYRWGRALAVTVLGAVAILVGGCLALVGGAVSAVGRLWTRAGGRPIAAPPWLEEGGRKAMTAAQEHTARWMADLRKLVALGLKVPSEGFGPAREELLTAEVRQVFETRRASAWIRSDLRIVSVAGFRTSVVVAAATLRWLYGHASELIRFGVEMIAYLGERVELRMRQEAVTRRTRRRWERNQPSGPLFRDPNDVLFLKVLASLVLLAALVFWWI